MNQVSLFFHGLWLLCGVGAVALTANPAPRWTDLGALALGFAAGLASGLRGGVPDPVWVGGAAACVAALLLFKPGTSALAAACGGALAAFWGVLLHLQGTPLAVAVVLAAAVPSLSAILAVRHPSFGPLHVREEALLVCLVLGLALAMAPGAAAGWQSAVALNVEAANSGQGAAVRQAIPAWTLATTVTATLLGGAYTMWRRR